MNFAKLAIVGALASTVSAVSVADDVNPGLNPSVQPGPNSEAGMDAVPRKIQDVIDVHDMVTRIYQDAMQQTISHIYKAHDKNESGDLDKKEALEFFYHVLGVVNQDRELAIAQYAADLANHDRTDDISRGDMEHFLVNLFTGQYDDHAYASYDENGAQ